MRDFSFVKTDQPTMLEFNKRFGSIADFANNVGSEYVWEKSAFTLDLQYGDILAFPAYAAAISGYSFTMYYSTELTTRGTLKNPQQTTVTYASPVETTQVLKGKFWSRQVDGTCRYTPVDASNAYIGKYVINGTTYSHTLYIYSQEAITNVTEEISYVNSPDPNAYPPILGTEYVMGEPVYTAVKIATVLFEAVTVNYYDNVSLTKTTGVVYPVGEMQSVSATNNTKTNFSVLSGKYVLWENKLHLCKPNDPYYVTEDTKYNFYLNLWEVSAVEQEITDECVYKALGQLGNKLQITTGSYTGTGTYGASNKNSLTFDFAPKLLVIFEQNNSDNGCGATMIYGATHYSTVPRASSGLMLHYSNVVAWSGNTVSWYNRINETNGWDVSNCILYQLNISGATYHYIAIG